MKKLDALDHLIAEQPHGQWRDYAARYAIWRLRAVSREDSKIKDLPRPEIKTSDETLVMEAANIRNRIDIILCREDGI